METSFSWILWINLCTFITTLAKNCSKPVHESCLKCDDSGLKCVKCRHVIVYGTGECVQNCPMGYSLEWSRYPQYMGQICVETSLYSGLGLSGQSFSVLIGALTGIILCTCALLAGCVYARRRRGKALSAIDDNSDSTMTGTPMEQQERSEFLREISLLRHEAPVFLAMLNETRRQVRELQKTRPNAKSRDAATQAYRPVLRDLYLILVLLNKPDDSITTLPADWRKLLAWGERVLKRFKRQNGITTPIGELVNFLQMPKTQRGSRVSLFQPYSTLSTVSTNTLASTTSRKHRQGSCAPPARRDSIMDMNDSLSDTNPIFPAAADFNRFSGAEDWGDDATPGNRTILAEWSASREYLFEDDFVRLGFRPQDEITTEL